MYICFLRFCTQSSLIAPLLTLFLFFISMKFNHSSSDRLVIIWDLGSGRILHTLRGHDGDVVALCVSAAGAAAAGRTLSVSEAYSGGLLISAGWDGTLRAWTTDTGECLRVVRTHPDGAGRHSPTLASLAAVGSGVVGGFVGGEVRVFDVWTGLAPEHVIRRHSCGCVQVTLPVLPSSTFQNCTSESLLTGLQLV
jgi:WD40 repeat protein